MKPVLIRNAELGDMPILHSLHRIQNERDGTNYPLPQFFNGDGSLRSSIPAALIGHVDGMVRNGIYVQRVGELMFAGCDPKATAFSRRDIGALASLLRWQGYEDLYCHVPADRVRAIAKPLLAAGFDDIRTRREPQVPLVTFYKDLRIIGGGE